MPLHRALRRTITRAAVIINVAAAVAMLVAGWSDRLYPPHFPMLANAGLLFPLFIVFNLLFLVAWTLAKSWRVLIPVAAFAACLPPIRTYCPLNRPQEPPYKGVRIMSFNVANFHYPGPHADESPFPALTYIGESGVHIACIQEAWMNKQKLNILRKYFHHVEAHRTPNLHENLVLASQFPILGSEGIETGGEMNGCVAFHLLAGTDTLTVINCHLLSYDLTMEERGHFSDIISGKTKGDSARSEMAFLLKKTARATIQRAPQADALVDYITAHPNRLFVVCGDFNSCPNSYVLYRLRQVLTDCYVETGLGPGWSFNRFNINVRLDHMLCSPSLRPIGCKVDRTVNHSDHYPISCWLKKRKHP